MEVASVKNASSAGEEMLLRFRKFDGQPPRRRSNSSGTYDGMYFRSGCCSAHIQVRQRRGGSKKSPCQIPIFVSGVRIKAQAQTGIAVERDRNGKREAAFFESQRASDVKLTASWPRL